MWIIHDLLVSCMNTYPASSSKPKVTRLGHKANVKYVGHVQFPWGTVTSSKKHILHAWLVTVTPSSRHIPYTSDHKPLHKIALTLQRSLPLHSPCGLNMGFPGLFSNVQSSWNMKLAEFSQNISIEKLGSDKPLNYQSKWRPGSYFLRNH